MKILVIDDDPDISEALSISISVRWPDTTLLTAKDGGTGVDLVDRERPDVVILDVGLPDMSGFEVCGRIREFSDVPIIMLTVRDRPIDKVKGLETGADDYVTKPFNYMELLSRVQAALRRSHTAPPAQMDDALPFVSGELTVDFGRRRALMSGEDVGLTPTEYRLLYHLVKNAGFTLPHETLLAKVWGREYMEDTEILKTHIYNLRRKLGDNPRDPRLVRTVHGVGYEFLKQ